MHVPRNDYVDDDNDQEGDDFGDDVEGDEVVVGSVEGDEGVAVGSSKSIKSGEGEINPLQIKWRRCIPSLKTSTLLHLVLPLCI